MDKTIDYYFSLVSPYTYMGGPRLFEMARKHGVSN
jgi:2-hydroxychromene-2-carboxylate isomerase